MAETRRLTELVDGALQRLELPPGPAVVALSGGADSAALAFLVDRTGVEVRCVHVDHGLAGSPLMSQAAEAVSAHLDLSLETISVTVAPGASPEGKAREARYSVLEKVPGPIITAHTLEDNAETVMINLIRGTGPQGLLGIPRHRRPNIHRPMLAISRNVTRELATLAGLPYAEDPMNDDLTLARNRIRRAILPLLAGLNPHVVATIARTGEVLAGDVAFIESLVPELDGSAVAVGLVETLPGPIADRLIARLLNAANVGATSDRIQRVWEVVRGEAPRRDLVGGKVVQRRGALVVIE